MMSISDIIQLVVLCALIFFPLGFMARHYWRRIKTTIRLMLFKPRYTRPMGTLRRPAIVKAKQKDD